MRHVALWSLFLACRHGAPPETARADAPCVPSVLVTVVDEHDAPLAGVPVWTTGSGKIGDTTSPIALTDERGEACVCDARAPHFARVNELRRQQTATVATGFPQGIGGAYDGPPPTSDYGIGGVVCVEGAVPRPLGWRRDAPSMKIVRARSTATASCRRDTSR